LGVHAGGGGVPKGEGRDPVGMDVFGARLQFGEAGKALAGRLELGAVHLQQNASVALHDDRFFRTVIHASFTASSSRKSTSKSIQAWRSRIEGAAASSSLGGPSNSSGSHSQRPAWAASQS